MTIPTRDAEQKQLEQAEWRAVQAIMQSIESATRKACEQLTLAVKAAPTQTVAIWTSLFQILVLKFSLEVHSLLKDPSFLEESGAAAIDDVLELARTCRFEVPKEEVADYEATLVQFEKGYSALREWVEKRRPPAGEVM